MKISKALVTGGAGFIGSHLVDKLAGDGVQVTVLDNLSEGRIENLHESLEKINLVTGDIRDSLIVKKLIQTTLPDVVFHLAANASVPNSVKDPQYDFETNALGTFNLLNAVKENSSAKVVLASTAAVYGESLHSLTENASPNPISPYGVSKFCAETIMFSFQRTFKTKVAVARIFNVYGPRLPRYIMHDFYKKLKANPSSLEVLGDGNQMRQFCYVADAVDALILLAEKGEEIYNIAGLETISVKELGAFMISKISPKAVMHFTGNSWSGDISNLTTDISKIQNLGFKPKVSLKQGISLTIDWFEKTFGSVCVQNPVQFAPSQQSNGFYENR